MDLIEYKTNHRFSKDNPTIFISSKGLMSFSYIVVEKLGLKPGDKVAFYQDKKNPIDWYFKVNDEGATLRSYYDGQRTGLMCNFVVVARRILRSINMDKSATMKVSTNPIENGMYAILTRSI